MSAARPVFLVTGADLAAEALALLGDFEVVYAGAKPTEADLIALCRQHLGEAALQPQRFRIGASSLLDDIEAVLGGTAAPVGQGGY